MRWDVKQLDNALDSAPCRIKLETPTLARKLWRALIHRREKRDLKWIGISLRETSITLYEAGPKSPPAIVIEVLEPAQDQDTTITQPQTEPV